MFSKKTLTARFQIWALMITSLILLRQMACCIFSFEKCHCQKHNDPASNAVGSISFRFTLPYGKTFTAVCCKLNFRRSSTESLKILPPGCLRVVCYFRLICHCCPEFALHYRNAALPGACWPRLRNRNSDPHFLLSQDSKEVSTPWEKKAWGPESSGPTVQELPSSASNGHQESAASPDLGLLLHIRWRVSIVTGISLNFHTPVDAQLPGSAK